MTVKEITKFSEFLHINGLKNSFIDNYKADDGLDIHSYLKLSHSDDVISGAFTWSRTPEGPNIWAQLDNVWKVYRKDNQ